MGRTVSLDGTNGLCVLPHLGAAVAQLAVGGEGDVRHPRLHAVEDVRGVDHCGAALLALVREEREEVEAAEDVEVHRDLVAQQHLEGLEQAQGVAAQVAFER
jgi:hypothetical protein